MLARELNAKFTVTTTPNFSAATVPCGKMRMPQENFKVSFDLIMTDWLICALAHRILAIGKPPAFYLCFKPVPQSNKFIVTASSITLSALLVDTIMTLTCLLLGLCSTPSPFPPTSNLYVDLLEPYMMQCTRISIANRWTQRMTVVAKMGSYFKIWGLVYSFDAASIQAIDSIGAADIPALR